MDEFKSSLYANLAAIPAGKLISYGQLATLCGYPNHARYVGRVLSALPKDSQLPWFRVVNSQGKISLMGEAFIRQRELLEKEGVIVSDSGKISHFKKRQY
ncbi:MGMT family protein [Psychromonas sp. MME2]|uniref:MGMT family protein n=1 Tax=unclassified Psychromonas TaxID=2614957 RepID=UPI00339C4A16